MAAIDARQGRRRARRRARGQLGPRFGAAAVAVWLLDADGALELLGQDGLDGTDSSRWRRLPPQFDCPEQRVIATGTDLWLQAGRQPGDPVPAAAPWGRERPARCSRSATGRHAARRGGGWWPTQRPVFDIGTRSDCRRRGGRIRRRARLRLAYGPSGLDRAVARGVPRT